MFRSLRPFVCLTVLALAAASLAACNTTSDPAPEDPADTGSDDIGQADVAVGDGGPVCTEGPGVAIVEPIYEEPDDCSMAEDLTGRTFIVNSLVLTEPSNQFLLESLNPLWEGDLKAGRLILLFHAKSHDLTTGEVTVEAGTGDYPSCSAYTWHDPPDEVRIQLDGCGWDTIEPASLSLWPSSMNKAIIVSRLEIDGYYNQAGTKIIGAYLQGVLTEEDATGLIAVLDPPEATLTIEMTDLFHAANIEMNGDADGDGVMDGWMLGGYLSGSTIENVDL